MDFRPIKTKKIAGEIIEQIKKMISERQIQPGDRLLSERELAEKLQVSRASLREALSALEMSGLIEIRPGEGTFLKKSSVEEKIEPLSLVLLMEKDSFDELLEVRKILEVSAANLAAERHSDRELKEMESALRQMEKDIAEKAIGEEADLNFHYSIALATHNSLLIRLMNTIADSMHVNLKESREKLFASPDNPVKLVAEHRAIYQAIKAQDGENAANLMYRHLDRVQKELSLYIQGGL